MTAASVVMVGALTSGSRARWIAWASFVLYVGATIVTLLLEFRFVGRIEVLDLWVVIALAASGLVGALIVSRHPRHPIGWMFCLTGLSFGTAAFAQSYAIVALTAQHRGLPAGELMAWLGFWISMPGTAEQKRRHDECHNPFLVWR